MSYTKTNWVNDTEPAINATNLNKIEDGIETNSIAIGDLTTLTTTAQTDLVSAVNEVDSHADTNATNIGDLTTLTTTAKSNVVSAVNELNNLKATKDIATTSANGLMSSTDKTTINNLNKTYQSKILKNNNAWQGTTNKITLPVVNYGFYLIISMTPFNNFSIYTLETHSGQLHTAKVAGGHDTTFSISGNELTLTLSQSSFWVSFALFLGQVS